MNYRSTEEEWSRGTEKKKGTISVRLGPDFRGHLKPFLGVDMWEKQMKNWRRLMAEPKC